MNKKQQKPAIVLVFSGIGLFIIGLVLSFKSLFNLYGIAGSSTSCTSNACLNNVNNDGLFAHIGIALTYIGIGLGLLGLIIIIYHSLKKKK
jgi:hypothetical protein